MTHRVYKAYNLSGIRLGSINLDEKGLAPAVVVVQKLSF